MERHVTLRQAQDSIKRRLTAIPLTFFETASILLAEMKIVSDCFRAVVALLLLPTIALAEAPGPIERVANTTLQLPLNPPVFGYVTTHAFPTLPPLTRPVALASPPGETNRLFILEKPGRIIVLTNLASPTRTLFLDINSRVSGGDSQNDEQGLLGLAFHPAFATNGYFYVFYTGNYTTTAGGGRHDILSRFAVSPANTNSASADSELVLLAQRDEASNHNGGDLHFGPDGYLYVSLGDEGGGNDQYNNSQRINRDFFSGILRIDVDKRPGSLPPNPHPAATTNYAIPPDNPFIGATNFNGLPVFPVTVRTEFHAVGLRNPWRMSFDPATGVLYGGDVGQNAREEIDVIVKGGNYGWAVREGTLDGPKASPLTAGLITIDPIAEYPRSLGRSVTGGLVYRGSRLSQLSGAYVFADYLSGHIWALWPDGTNAVPFQRLTGDTDIVAFGVDPRNGDVLLADHVEGRIKRLAYSSEFTGAPLPPALADTGAFSDLANLTPEPGIIPYQLNVPFWSDGAEKKRWFSIPDSSGKIGFSRAGNWSFPIGSVWIKHFDLELTNGVPESKRRLETRFIVRNDDGVYGVTYRWDDAQETATLVPEEGMDEAFVIHDGDATRTQVWHYPSRSECLNCHTEGGGWALGFNTVQLNRAVDYEGSAHNQIRALSEAGYFVDDVTDLHTLHALVAPTNEAASLEARMRSYLAANCSQCHQPEGTALGFFDARFNTLTAQAGLIGGPLRDSGGSEQNRVIVPGSPQRSMLLQRIAVRGSAQMPPISSTVADTNAVELLTRWIRDDAPRFQTYAGLLFDNGVDATVPKAAPNADLDEDGLPNYLEYLIGSSPLLGIGTWRVSVQSNGDKVEIRFPQIANRGFEVQVTSDLQPPVTWQPLDVPGNAPFFSASNFEAVVEDSISPDANKFYRVRVFER